MTEQMETVTNTSKTDHSEKYACCRLSYDCLMASTKSFVNNFNNLSPEEKQQFKSLHNYVKQLEKCMLTIRTNQSKITIVKRAPKIDQKKSTVPEAIQVNAKESVSDQESVSVSISGSTTVSKGKGNGNGKGKGKVSKEVSPTAKIVEEARAESALAASTTTASTSSSTSKRGKSQKQVATVPVVATQVASNVSAPSSSETKKPSTKKTTNK
jgi:hypothetical protein